MNRINELHAKIMNLPCDDAHQNWANAPEAYTHGHRDARHAAAELALKVDSQPVQPVDVAAYRLTESNVLDLIQWIRQGNVQRVLNALVNLRAIDEAAQPVQPAQGDAQ